MSGPNKPPAGSWRLPRRFYIYLGVVLVCLIAVLASFRFIGAEGLLVLLPALVIAIPCLTAAAKVFRVAVFPSPEKQAAQATAQMARTAQA